jgi:pimeloyl-ACP methyl ester carboxylesterase
MTAFSSLETEIVPFRVAIPEAAVTDLRERLAMSRFPHDTAGGWVHGQSVELMRELAAAWHGFDWRAAEARLNSYPQFTTRIDGQTIHFVHVKSTEPNAFPLILTHGWPSTYFEYYDVIERLTDPRSHGLDPSLAFDLVIPSIPGYGFSTPLETPGWNSLRIARAWDQLMKRLGYQRYGAQGGDTGSIISQELGVLAPEGLAGVHVQQIFAFPTGAPGEMEKLSPFEQEGFANLETYLKYDGYRAIQEKRPGTLGFGLVDSPVALLAWNAELFFGFEGEGVERVDRQAYLTHVSIYWFTASGGSAAALYFEDAQCGAGAREVFNATPTGVAVFPWDFRSVRSFAERSNNIVHWTEMPRGGHFATMDAPDLLVEDMRNFFGPLR